MSESRQGHLQRVSRSVFAFPSQLLDPGFEIGAYVAVVVALSKSGGDCRRVERFAFVLQFGDDTVQDADHLREVSVYRIEKGSVFARAPTADGYTPPGVELFGAQPVGREYDTAFTQAQHLNDQCVIFTGGVLADIEHRFDRCFRHKSQFIHKMASR